MNLTKLRGMLLNETSPAIEFLSAATFKIYSIYMCYFSDCKHASHLQVTGCCSQELWRHGS